MLEEDEAVWVDRGDGGGGSEGQGERAIEKGPPGDQDGQEDAVGTGPLDTPLYSVPPIPHRQDASALIAYAESIRPRAAANAEELLDWSTSATNLGFGIARFWTDLGFGIARTVGGTAVGGVGWGIDRLVDVGTSWPGPGSGAEGGGPRSLPGQYNDDSEETAHFSRDVRGMALEDIPSAGTLGEATTDALMPRTLPKDADDPPVPHLPSQSATTFLTSIYNGVLDLAQTATNSALEITNKVAAASLSTTSSLIASLDFFFPSHPAEAQIALRAFARLVSDEYAGRAFEDPDARAVEEVNLSRFGRIEIWKALVAYVAMQNVTAEARARRIVANGWLEEVSLVGNAKEQGSSGSTDGRPFTTKPAPGRDAVDAQSQAQEAEWEDITHDQVDDFEDFPSPGREHKPLDGDAKAQHASALPETQTETEFRDSDPFAPTESDVHAPADIDRLHQNFKRYTRFCLGAYGGLANLFFGLSMPNAQPREAGESLHPESYHWFDIIRGRHDTVVFDHVVYREDNDVPFLQPKGDAEARRTEAALPNLLPKLETRKSLKENIYTPRNYLCVDHRAKEVVLACRGTLSLNDIAIDLTCGSAEFKVAADLLRERAHGSGVTPAPVYRVHAGMLGAAVEMAIENKTICQSVGKALEENPGYSLAICGHSLGAGMASMLAVMWADPDTGLTLPVAHLPAGRRVHAWAIAPPCVFDAPLTKRARNLVTGLVYNFDIVSRLSLGHVRDIRAVIAFMAESDRSEGGSAGGGGGAGSTNVMAKAMKIRNNPDPSAEDLLWFDVLEETVASKMKHSHLVPPGTSYWMLKNDSWPSGVAIKMASNEVRDDEAETRSEGKVWRLCRVLNAEGVYKEMIFHRRMLSDHMPDVQIRAIAEL